MSNASTPGSAPTPKAMSSRLLTMKFMQRAASNSTPSTPTTSDEPPNKRRKKDSDSTPLNFNVDALADHRAVQKALADEEAKRQAALERQAAEAGDTRWVLSFEDQKQTAASPALGLRVVQTGYANLDSFQVQSMQEEPEDKPVMVGRRSFGKFNKVLERQQKPADEDYSDSESDEGEDSNSEDDEEEEDDDDPSKGYYNDSRANEATERLKKQRKSQKKEDRAASWKQSKDRKKKEVNLNGLKSLSGRSGGAGPCHKCGGPHMKKDCPELAQAISCFNCGGPHMKRDCPELNGSNKRGFGGGDDGPPRKTVRAS